MSRKPARTIRSSTDLTQEALEIVLLKPLRCGLETFRADRGGDTCGRRAGAVAVEVLVHL